MMIKGSSYNFLKLIIESDERDINRICLLHKINKKQFWYELSNLNDELKKIDEQIITYDKGKIIIGKKLIDRLDIVLAYRKIALFESPRDRIYFLYIYISITDEFLSTSHFVDFLSISRNAVMLDLKRLREWTKYEGVELLYSRGRGYYLQGEERSIRKLIEKAIYKLQDKYTLKDIYIIYEDFFDSQFNIYRMYNHISEYTSLNNIDIIYDRMEEFIYFLPYINARINKGTPKFSSLEKNILEIHPIHNIALELSGKIYGNASRDEILFLESRFLGVIQGDSTVPVVSYFKKIVDDIIFQMQILIPLDSYNLKELKKTLYQHLVPAYYRLKFDLYYHNPLLDKIKRDYEELFELTRIALQPLIKVINKPISESEIAYFTIHFGGYLKSENRNKVVEKLRALAVCPNGISSSLIMATTLRETFPEMEIINTHNIEDVKHLDSDSYDLIFSTTYFATTKKIYITSPILNGIEKDVIREKVSNDFKQIKKPQVINTSDLVTIIERHVTINNKKELIDDLNSYIYNRNFVYKKEMQTLTDLLVEKNIRISNKQLTWREAIREASKPLLENNSIDDAYADAMIETVEKIGPYIVLAPKVAVPHARPERGVNKLGISLLKLNKEVDFNTDEEEDPDRLVKLIFVLAAVDGEAHLKALMQLSRILDEEKYIDQLINLNNESDIFNRINKLVNKGEDQND